MRTIKFRGKTQHSGKWIIGNLFQTHRGESFIIPVNYCETDGHHAKIDSDEPFSVDPATIGQFTGLIDKNGKEIFEGDVIDNLIVTYCGDTDAGLGMQAGFYLQRNDFEVFAPLESNLTDIVRGNIHDNPELLEPEK